MPYGQSLQKFFAGITEFTFQTRLGVADPPLLDYLSDLLSRYCRLEQVFPVRDVEGRRLTRLSDMLRESQAREGEARVNIHRQIGDFTLFWGGVFPEALKVLQGHDQVDHLLDYRTYGKKAYAAAARFKDDFPHDSNARSVDGSVLNRLAEEYDLCLYGLGEVRREWEHLEDTSAGIELWGE